MRAVVMDRFEDVSRARIAEVPMPELRPGEVLIQVAAAGVNPADWKEAQGCGQQHYRLNHPAMKLREFPMVLGFDAAGRVAKVGDDTSGVEAGDAVMVFSIFSDSRRGEHRQGSFAEYLSVPLHLVAEMPRSCSYEQAAAIPCAAMTGYQNLFRPDMGNLKAADKVLIHGASGGVGSFAVQFAKQAGLSVAATCRPPNASYVHGLGADVVFDSTSPSIGEQARRWSAAGVAAIIDCVSKGSLSLIQAMTALQPGGRIVSIGTLNDDGDVEGDTREAGRNGFTTVVTTMNFHNLRAQFQPIVALIESGRVKIPPVEIAPMKEAAKVLCGIRDGHTKGKIVLEIADGPRVSPWKSKFQ